MLVARMSSKTLTVFTTIVMAFLGTTVLAGTQCNAPVGGFQVVQPDSQASGMMMALIDEENVMIIDKSENNRARINGGDKPVWGVVMSLNDFSIRALDMITNPFCASGAVLGNGTWMVAGGNQAVSYGGAAIENISPGQAPYQDYSGNKAIRLMDPQNNAADLNWNDNTTFMDSMRWYPGIEVMTDGSVLLIGGATGGGYINRNTPNTDPAFEAGGQGSLQNLAAGGANPTWEFFPSKGNQPAINNFMVTTSGLNMYPHTYLMPSGKLFMQANYSTVLWQMHKNDEDTAYDQLDDMPQRELSRLFALPS